MELFFIKSANANEQRVVASEALRAKLMLLNASVVTESRVNDVDPSVSKYCKGNVDTVGMSKWPHSTASAVGDKLAESCRGFRVRASTSGFDPLSESGASKALSPSRLGWPS